MSIEKGNHRKPGWGGNRPGAGAKKVKTEVRVGTIHVVSIGGKDYIAEVDCVRPLHSRVTAAPVSPAESGLPPVTEQMVAGLAAEIATQTEAV